VSVHLSLAELEQIGHQRPLSPAESACLFRQLANDVRRRARVPARIERARRKLARLRVRRVQTEQQIERTLERIRQLEAELYPEARIARIEQELVS
jgi:sugar phosphate isomerase/epimerase